MAPIHWACRDGDIQEVQRLVAAHPAQIQALLLPGCWTPLFWAVWGGSPEVARLLLQRGADVNQKDRNGSTPLHLACRRGATDTVVLLLRWGADSRAHTLGGESPLHVAAASANVGALTALLQHGRCHLDALDYGGGTALWAAARTGCLEGVRLLLEAGAAHRLADSLLGTPAEVARRKGRKACLALLEEAERSYLLAKTRGLQDAILSQAAAAGHTHWQPRPSTAPAYLRARAGGCARPLPRVWVAGEEGAFPAAVNGFRRFAVGDLAAADVLAYVIRDLKADLFVELLHMLGRAGEHLCALA